MSREEAEQILRGHKSFLDRLTPEQLREIAEMDEPAVMCGRVDVANARKHQRFSTDKDSA